MAGTYSQEGSAQIWEQRFLIGISGQTHRDQRTKAMLRKLGGGGGGKGLKMICFIFKLYMDF